MVRILCEAGNYDSCCRFIGYCVEKDSEMIDFCGDAIMEITPHIMKIEFP